VSPSPAPAPAPAPHLEAWEHKVLSAKEEHDAVEQIIAAEIESVKTVVGLDHEESAVHAEELEVWEMLVVAEKHEEAVHRRNTEKKEALQVAAALVSREDTKKTPETTSKQASKVSSDPTPEKKIIYDYNSEVRSSFSGNSSQYDDTSIAAFPSIAISTSNTTTSSSATANSTAPTTTTEQPKKRFSAWLSGGSSVLQMALDTMGTISTTATKEKEKEKETDKDKDKDSFSLTSAPLSADQMVNRRASRFSAVGK
jgi:hypothetical protein